MKRNLQIILTTTTASLLTLTVTAQQNTPPKTDRSVYAGDRVGSPQAARLHSAAKASEIIGMTVNNYQEEKLGSVEDLAVDVESGRIVQVILSTGGFIGMGERLSAVPPGAMHYDVAKNVLHLDANKEKLKGAPEFKTSNWAESSDSDHLSAVYTYYGQESALSSVRKADILDETGDTLTTRNADGTLSKSQVLGDNQSKTAASRIGRVQKASKLMGQVVKNQQGEEVGKVDNMLMDVQSGRIVAVVVSSGGFLGMRDELSAVPPTALSFNAERDTLQLDTSKERLSAAPHFKSDQWPDFNQPAYSDSVYRAYQVEPYFAANIVTDADDSARNLRNANNSARIVSDTDKTSRNVRDVDNTARNVRDRDDRTLTPLDQGNSKADTETTAQIRKGILAGKGMSTSAKNVKIITDKGRVTLRGPVQSEDEKRLIGEIANRVARAENVDNQLEVALHTTSN